MFIIKDELHSVFILFVLGGINLNTIITISRAFGSNGREIGKQVAEKLNIKWYDKDLMKRAAEESGLCTEIFENHDEKPTSSFLYNLVMDTYSFGYSSSTYIDMPIGHKVFLAQFDAIKKIADEGPCVIIGRCADYALAERENVLNIFIYSDIESRIKHIMERYDLSEDKAKDMINKKDKQRSNYYNFYSNKKWGRAESYDMCIDSSVLGIDGTANLICQLIDDFENKAK